MLRRRFFLAAATMFLVTAGLAVAPRLARAKEDLPTLRSTRPVVSIRQGSALAPDSWRLAPDVKPDVFEAELPDGKPVRVTFLSDVDSISFQVEEGSRHDFVIRHGSDRCLTRVVGVRVVPMAVFDEGYQAKHRGTITAEIPEVYELVNIVLAMTPTGIADSNLVYQASPYYRDVRAWFDPHRAHSAVAALDSMLRINRNLYFNLKMNGYSFELDGNGRIARSRIYDRTGFPGERRNALLPFLDRLQSFADTTRFRAFYERNRSVYDAQIAFYRDSADVKEMLAWLNRNFPKSGGYDSNKIIFSPLVAYNQSATWLESGGFRELQAHVNFPYPGDWRRRGGVPLSQAAETVARGHIVFTELNHGYVNPEADKYADRVLQAISRRDRWVDPARGRGYYGGISAFNEYMNWGLANLRVVDIAPMEDQSTLLSLIDDMMTKSRGFPMFAEFSRYLVGRYRARKPGESIADLYPEIIAWFEARNSSSAAR
ncbi:MAG TPA: DUF4932 domain-containing protein [Candidatus Eisenbacteria bacterium]|nr:DUF4932 domain-containing protein [Candidatus Eisenbacteria bacterium]